MGGCVASVMESRSNGSLEDHYWMEKLRAYGVQSRAVPGTESNNGTPHYRTGHLYEENVFNSKVKELYFGPNMTQRFQETCASRKEQIAIAYRTVNKVAREVTVLPSGERKEMEITYLNDTEHKTYGELWERIEMFARGLGELGLPDGSNISIYEETRWEWLSTIYAIWMRHLVASTVYANLGEEALFYALRETECQAIICNGRSAPNLLRGMASGSIPPCTIIYLDDLPADIDCKALFDGARVISWTDVCELGRKSSAAISAPTDNDAIALIMYTSGTTGDPKGVMHSHGSIASGVIIMDEWLSRVYHKQDDDTYIAYLPLAHILEFGVVNIFLARGSLVGFGNPRTLTDISARPHGDLQEYKPTAFIGVPRIFDTIRKAVEAKLPPPGSLRRHIFDKAYQSRLDSLNAGKETPYWNEKVFKPARQVLGGRFRMLLSGGGPLSAATQEFVQVVFGMIVNGWGLTETVCVGAIQISGDMDTGVNGHVLIGEELKLVDADEYKHTDSPEPRGEICLRGPFLFKGYYRQPELTAQALDSEGWFHTGDIGSITDQGKIRVIGRIKALAKNCLGEYIALEMLEAIYSSHTLVVNNCICVLVHPDRNYIAAIIMTEAFKVEQFAASKGICKGMSSSEIVSNPEFLRLALAELNGVAKAAGRKRFEELRYVCFVEDVWTPENGILTAAMKLRRAAINDKYAEQVTSLFSDVGTAL